MHLNIDNIKYSLILLKYTFSVNINERNIQNVFGKYYNLINPDLHFMTW